MAQRLHRPDLQCGKKFEHLLEEIVSSNLSQSDRESDAERQRALHARSAEFAGCLTGDDSRRAERARELVRTRLKKRNDFAD